MQPKTFSPAAPPPFRHRSATVVRRALLFTTFVLLPSWGQAQLPSQLDNSALIPKIAPDAEVKLEGTAPEWVKSLVMAEVRLETATAQGTLTAATKVLDHYAEMGVNGLWITPIYDRANPGQNGYTNSGPQAFFPALTGTADTDGSLGELKKFVDEAHRRNIRILFDIIVWGTRTDSPLVSTHPEFYTKKGGNFVEVWGGYAFDWTSADLKNWFEGEAVKLIERTGADGFRVDLAPDTSGYFFKEIRDALYAEGRKIVIMSEINNPRRDTFDFEETSVTGWTERPNYAHPDKHKEQKQRFGTHNEYLFHDNIVDVVRSGRGIGDVNMQQAGTGGTLRFYTSNLLNHDDPAPFAAGNRVRFAYATLFAPFLPIWWIGEEWNNPKALLSPGGGVMYFNRIDWNQLPPNQTFYEDVKKYIRIRRSYPAIFEQFPESARDANITKLASTRNGVANPLQAYARFAGGKAVLIVPNYQNEKAEFEVRPDDTALGLGPLRTDHVTDLMTGEVIPIQTGVREDDRTFTRVIDRDRLGIYLLDNASADDAN